MKPEEEFRYLILGAQREGNRIFAEALQIYDVTPSQAEVITLLNDYGSLSLLELGQRLVCESGSPSRLVDGLVKAGLVDRKTASEDRRRVDLSLTRTGKAKAVKVIKAEEAIYKVIRTLIPANQILTLNKALLGLLANRSSGDAIALRRSQS
ncbi:MAG TPA: MarR family transcriptional regulator [Candidatus Paceibacterota bacterium]|nr:MarR family transcriptional regulator [Candidatus Paceibacterota bacterium]